MIRVYLLSPLAGDIERNLAYAREALLDSLRRGEAPYAPHLLYTQVLDDRIPGDRELGITAGAAFLGVVDRGVAYLDLGLSPGMTAESCWLTCHGVPIETRLIRG